VVPSLRGSTCPRSLFVSTGSPLGSDRSATAGNLLNWLGTSARNAVAANARTNAPNIKRFRRRSGGLSNCSVMRDGDARASVSEGAGSRSRAQVASPGSTSTSSGLTTLFSPCRVTPSWDAGVSISRLGRDVEPQGTAFGTGAHTVAPLGDAPRRWPIIERQRARLFFRTLPLSVFGSWSTRTTSRGTMKFSSRSRQARMISLSSSDAPSAGTT
jgi:hypothetical protein